MKPILVSRSYKNIEIKTADYLSQIKCCVCDKKIMAKEKYYDGGWGRRAHIDCVENPFTMAGCAIPAFKIRDMISDFEFEMGLGNQDGVATKILDALQSLIPPRKEMNHGNNTYRNRRNNR